LGITPEETVKKFEGCGYGEFKLAVGEAVADCLDPVRERYNEYISNKKLLEELAKNGAEKAYYASRKTMSKVMKKVGFVL
jgi:tryptophanyl-tRNA synthetase